jgi:RNA polymerase sigma-70 factor (ECF subfamily)
LDALNAVDKIETLDRYQPYHVARADMLRRSGDRTAAHAAYRLAWQLTDNERERSFLETRLAETQP